MKTSVKKTAVIVGCSQMGARLAMSLSSKGYKVVIMDKDYHAFERIDRHFLGTEFMGDGQDLAALRSLGVDNIKLFVARPETMPTTLPCHARPKSFITWAASTQG